MPGLDAAGDQSLPSDVAKALRVLPAGRGAAGPDRRLNRRDVALRTGIWKFGEDTSALAGIADDVRSIAAVMEVLPAVDTRVQAVADDTAVLPGVKDELARVASAAQVLPSMDARLAKVEETMPVLVEVQHLSALPETTETLGAASSGSRT